MSTLAIAHHHLVTGRPERSLEALDHLPGDDALHADALLLRGRALLGLDRDREARLVAERALAADADDPALWSLLADACWALDELPSAEQALLAALRLRPTDAGLMADYSRILAEAGQDDKASSVLRRAAELDPESPEVATARTYLALACGDDRAALVAAKKAIARAPDSVAAQSMLGVSSMLRGDGAMALRASRSAASASIGNRQLAGLAREARLQAHPLMAGMRLITRFGQAKVWIFGLVLVTLSSSLLPTPVAPVVAGLWLLFILYSWTATPALRAWARRRW